MLDDDPNKHGELFPICVPEKNLADFGIGITLYFNQVKYFAILCFVCGLICLPLINHNLQGQSGIVTIPQFFLGPDQTFEEVSKFSDCASPVFESSIRLVTCQEYLPNSLMGSFLTNTAFVRDVFVSPKNENVYVEEGSAEFNGTVEFLNVHPIHSLQIITGVAVLVLLLLFAACSFKIEEASIEKADLRVQTAQDYSIEIKDPYKDEFNPDVYKVCMLLFSSLHR